MMLTMFTTMLLRYIYVYIRADSNLSEYNFEGMRQKMLLLCCWTYKDYEAIKHYA